MSIKIDKGVPVPKAIHNGRSKYPFQQMEVGDSFFAETAPEVMRSSANQRRLKYGTQFIVRAEGSGARCWRTA